MKINIKTIKLSSALLAAALLASPVVKAEFLDHIVAVVEDDVILERELSIETHNIAQKLKSNKVMVPPDFILRKQVLERIIIDKLQKQMAERSGIRVNDAMLKSSSTDIARRNNLTLSEFRRELEGQGISFKQFQSDLKSEIIINQLRAKEIGSRIKVTDREVNHYLETQGEIGEEKIQYHLGHILISVPEAASSMIIQKAVIKAESVIESLRSGADFHKTAMSFSDSDSALTGGDLGWRTLGKIPTILVDSTAKMKKNEVANLIRSPSGFHIIKLIDKKGLDKHIVTKTKARHILIKTNELLGDEDAQKRLLALRDRINDGDDFETLARSNSDDKASALDGGGLGWVGKGDLVPPFEAAMNKLSLNEISPPVQTQFGWHIIQVLERKDKDNSTEHKKSRIKEEIRKKKIEEETELWLRRLRDEAFVDIKLDRL